MATTVYTVQELILDDGSTITCKPANLKVMRKGQELLARLPEIEDNDESINALLDIVALCTKKERPEFEVDVLDDEGNKTGKKTTNYDLMEELFDMSTIFKVIELFFGVNFADPKALEAAAQLALLQEQQKAASGQS